MGRKIQRAVPHWCSQFAPVIKQNSDPILYFLFKVQPLKQTMAFKCGQVLLVQALRKKISSFQRTKSFTPSA